MSQHTETIVSNLQRELRQRKHDGLYGLIAGIVIGVILAGFW